MIILNLRNDPQYQLFLYTHYSKMDIPSYNPVWTKDGYYFNYNRVLVKRDLSIIDKIRYYIKDFKLYIKERKQR